ncbi:hypothetical protein AOLI_G00158090 [Acnodon oligacanthus]
MRIPAQYYQRRLDGEVAPILTHVSVSQITNTCLTRQLRSCVFYPPCFSSITTSRTTIHFCFWFSTDQELSQT